MTTQEQVKDVVSQVLADKADKGGIKRVVWIGAGGSNGGNYPAQYFMEHEATQVVSSSYTSNEFVHATPAYVNENTLAVVVSMRGTKETIVAAQVAKDHGASTIAIYVDESGLTEVCDYKIQYDSLAVDESCMGRTNSAVVTMIAMELTQQTEGYAEYETAMAAFDLVDPIYRKAVEYTRPLAAKWAEQNADKPCINVMAQGPLFGAAYVFSICNVQEMLQIDSCTINTCDFFHGPFEILDKRTSLFQLISVGRSRCNDERGIRFVNQYGGERVYQLDAKELGLNDIKDSVSEYFNHLIFAPILNNVYMRALSAVTHKDYMTRRYMWKLDYKELRVFTKPRNGSTLRGPHLDNLTFNFKGATRRSAPFRFTPPCLKCGPLAHMTQSAVKSHNGPPDRVQTVGGACR